SDPRARKPLFKAGIAYRFPSFQNPQITQHAGGGTDGADPFSFPVPLAQKPAQPFVGTQIPGSRHSSRKHQQIPAGKSRFLKQAVRLPPDIVGSGDLFSSHDGDHLHILSRSSEKIHNRQALHFLKSVCQKYMYFCHTLSSFLYYIFIFQSCPCQKPLLLAAETGTFDSVRFLLILSKPPENPLFHAILFHGVVLCFRNICRKFSGRSASAVT